MFSPASPTSGTRRSAVTGPTLRVAALVAALLVLSGCTRAEPITSSATSPQRPTSTTAPTTSEPVDALGSVPGIPEGWSPAPLAWGACDDPSITECATLTVPLDWSDVEGPTIDLALGRQRALREPIGPLLMNPGGPGASGLEFLSYSPVSSELRDRFDLVSWDPRGVGGSNAVSCGAGSAELFSLDPSPDDAEETAALEQAAATLTSGCAGDLALLEQIGTWNVARDMEAIRRALGSPPLNYLGFSYGTHIGQAYAEMFPGEIRAMVLDGVVDPAQGFTEFLLGQTVAFDAAFERNAAACAAAGRSACGVDDLGAAYDQVMAQVEAAPLGSGTRTVGPGELGTAAVATSYRSDGWSDLGPALSDALDGDGSELRRLAESYYDFGSYGAYAGVVCTDSAPPRGAAAFREFVAQAEALSPRFGAGVANEMLPCATWPAAPTGDPTAITAPGAPPILVVGNTGDAATPYENAVVVAERLSSGVLVSADIDGHTAYGSNQCVTRVVDDYLIRLVVPSTDPRCS
ncbi:MAG: alpha/beta hydrolase [Actinomycetota bacterium]|nr:alpha/beta hydrolase [Actinomycetota bacterium]